MVALLVFIIAILEIVFGQKKLLGAKGLFGDNVVKNLARYIYVYEVYGWVDPIKSVQYVSRAEYTMVSKEKKCYNIVSTKAVSSAVTLTHQETLMGRMFTSKEYI